MSLTALAPTSTAAEQRVRILLVALGLLAGLAAGISYGPAAGVLALGFLLVVALRPLDLFAAMLMATAAAAFAEYGDPHITRDLAGVAVLTAYTLLSFAATNAARGWGLPRSRLTWALAGLALTTALALARGWMAGNSMRAASLEIFPVLALFLALAIGGIRIAPGDLRVAARSLVAVGLASSAVGIVVLALTRIRMQGQPFSPIPGLIALVLLNLMLFDPRPRPRVLWIVILGVLLFHQIITFTRGYWLALLGAMPFSVAMYAYRNRWRPAAWRKGIRILAITAALLFGLGLVASTALGLSEIMGMLGSRFGSSFTTRSTPETVSNVVRLVELRTTLGHIARSPWLGHGHGYTIFVRQFFYADRTGQQWWVHESYAMILLKQGLVGLAALLALLWVALRMGIRGTAQADPQVAGWSAASAACTVFAVILGLTNYFFFMVNQAYLLALLWGITLSLGRPDRVLFAWRGPAPEPGA